MAKNETRPAEPAAVRSNTTAGPGSIDTQLAPLNEFRERADSWMKEITAQVARLAGRSEDEERRKKALDDRLADIETRMQSLLTLTEMVSLSKNPFAGPSRTPTDEAGPKTARPSPPEAPPKQAAAPPDPVPEAREASPEHATEPPAVPRPPSTARAPGPARLHPNDAQAERRPPSPSVPSVADTFPRPGERNAGPAGPPGSAGPVGPVPADHRFFVLEWARLLAPMATRIDLRAFLGFYEEAGWVAPGLTRAVRTLAEQLQGEAEGHTMDLEELHARSILLVSRLEGNPSRPAEAAVVLRDARESAFGDWAIIER